MKTSFRAKIIFESERYSSFAMPSAKDILTFEKIREDIFTGKVEKS